MSNLLKLLAVGILMLLVTNTTAQTFSEKNNDRNIVPPPPTEGALGKYGYYPVSMYSGLPNISIPLFEVKDKNLTLPISLSYHASGIKVDEIASWVGLGWSLNAGGVISRTVVGSPDELPNDGYWTMAKGMSDPNFSNSYTPPIQIVYQASQGIKDFEPDMFSFNFMGYSGSFLVDPFDWDNDNVRECHIYPQANITIRYENGVFKAVDYTGVEYSFSVKNSLSTTNKTKVNNGNENITTTLSHTSTWLLTRIYDPNSQAEIKLAYAPVTEKYDYTKTYSIGKSFSENVNLEKRIRTLSQGTSSSYYLDSIICKNEFVKFNRDANRQDLPEGSGCSLSSIEKGRLGDTRKIKYTLGYGYFSNGSAPAPDIHRTRRLKLDNIILKGENGEFGGIHRFSYYGDMLPERGSYSQDYWGYFNNKPNTTPIPPFKQGDQGADLRPDATGSYMQANTLKTISYPTGGSSEFIYEPHDYSNDNGIDIPLTTTILETTPHHQYIEVTYTELTLIQPPSSYVVDFDLQADMIVDFDCNFDGEFYDVLLTKDGIDVPISSNNATPNPQHIFLTQGHYDVLLRLNKLASNPDDEPESAKLTITYFTESTETIKALPSGGLRIKEIKSTSDVGKHLIKRYSYLLGSDPSRSSGVRSDFRPKYSSVENEVFQQEIGQLSGYASRAWDMKFGRNQYCYALTSGSTVGYREVKESGFDLDANGHEVSNGFTVYKYTSCVDIRDGSYGTVSTIGGENTSGQPVYGPNTDIDVVKDDADYLRGRLDTTTVYNANGFPVKMEELTYTPPTTSYLIPGIRFSTNSYEIFGPDIPFLEQYCKLTFTRYFRSVQKSLLSSKKESLYVGFSAENGQMYNVSTTDYTYNRNQQVTSERVTPITLPASAVEKRTYYPDMTTEIPSGLPGLDANLLNLMEAKNMLAIPVFTEQFKGNTCTNRAVNQFYDNGGDVLLKGRYSFDFKDGMYYNTVSFNHSDRNIVDVYKEGDLNEAYCWGYNGRYPVVKAANVPYPTLSSAIGAALGSLAAPFSSLDALLNAIDGPDDTRWGDFNKSLRSNSSLAGCPITTYTHDPIFGITSQTDPNGLTTYYEYDGLGRLAMVKDNNGNILKNYDYHYKGFKPKIITSTAGGGNISPQNPEVELEGSISLTILPDPGYLVKHLTVNGNQHDAALSYTFHGVTSDQTLVATFEIITHTVTFNSQGGTPVPSITVNHGSTITEPVQPTRDGHTFGRWYKDAACTNPWSFAGDAVTSDITLYASWTINTYAITFDPQGGSAVAGISAIYSTKISPPAPPAYPDYTFGGWYREAGCIGRWDFDNDVISTNTTLYAKWVCTVTFNTQVGIAVAPMVVERNAKIIPPEAPARAGYDFWGWYKEPSCNNSWSFDGDRVSKNTTLYARWNPKQYAVNVVKIGNGTVKRSNNPDSPEDIGPFQVDYNSYITFYFSPAAGYSIKYVKVDGVSVGTPSSYSVHVLGDVTLTVEFYIPPPPASYLEVNPTSLSFGADGGSATFSISSNVSWSITTNTSGLMVSPSSGSASATITVDCDQLLGTPNPRITVTGGGITRIITVTKENNSL